MKRITRRQARSWLSPMRDCFLQMLEGEVDAINGYPVTRLHHDDDYARIDYSLGEFNQPGHGTYDKNNCANAKCNPDQLRH